MVNTSLVLILASSTTLAIVFLLQAFSINVGMKRQKHKLPAPAMFGQKDVEHALRIQGNTLEQVMSFLPLLWFCYLMPFSPWIPTGLGAIWIIGRILYARGYTKSADQRHLGTLFTMLALLGMIIALVTGIMLLLS